MNDLTRFDSANMDLKIKGLSLDSRLVKPGDLFFALAGYTDDGRRYIADAIAKGAVAVLQEEWVVETFPPLYGLLQKKSNEKKHHEKNNNEKNSNEKKNHEKTLPLNSKNSNETINNLTAGVPVIRFSNLRKSVSAIAGRFFADPSKDLNLIAITGTNGKTSCSHFIAQILSELNLPCAVMGTLGSGFLPKAAEAEIKDNAVSNDMNVAVDKNSLNMDVNNMTTVDPINVQARLADLKNKGAKAVAMEVTSHALAQGRVEALQIKSAIFTNLTRDHLDYHLDMANYFAAKKRLFTELKPRNIIINLEDEHGQLLLEELLTTKPTMDHLIAYCTSEEVLTQFKQRLENSLRNYSQINRQNNPHHGLKLQYLLANNLRFTETGFSADLKTPWGEGKLVCPLLGRFNVSNVLAAIAAVCLENIALDKVLTVVKHLKTVAGRMNSISAHKNAPRVVVDYAHTPDALTQVLQALRLHCSGKLFCVFGCGGDRDKGKRSQMASVAEAFSDQVIVTQDNPRTENPNNIIQDIMQGFKLPNQVMIELSRKDAIALAIKTANAGDMILIAGKGHEDYQIIGTEKIPFSDKLAVQEILRLQSY